MRRFILQWLFGYYTPKFLNTTEFYKNIKWVETKEQYGIKKSFQFNGFAIEESRMSYNNYPVEWAIRTPDDPVEGYHLMHDYGVMIIKLHDLLHFGIIMPENK